MHDGSDKEISQGRLRAAWGVAFFADLVQIVFFPLFWAGAASPLDDALDVVVAGALTALVGWHWSFLPSFLIKLMPAVDLVPTWSAAMLLARRKAVLPREPEKVVLELPKRLPSAAPHAASPAQQPALPATLGRPAPSEEKLEAGYSPSPAKEDATR